MLARTPRTKQVIKQRTSSVPPALRLKALRQRTRFSARECAEFLAKKLDKKGPGGKAISGHANTWQRYEDPSPAQQGDRKIPYRIIKAIMPFLVGAGDPPITEEELLAVSEADDLGYQIADLKARVSVERALPHYAKDAAGVRLLRVKYLAEEDGYLTREMVEMRDLGLGPIAVESTIKQDQACVRVGDDHASSLYPKGTVLHVVHPSAYSPDGMEGRKVLVRQDVKGGLCRLVIGRVHAVRGNRFVLKGIQDDKALPGEIIGVVFRSLREE